MIILGISAPISENTSACIVKDGELLALAEEERFIGIKHAPRMVPRNAVKYCLNETGIELDQVDKIAIGFGSPLNAGAKNIFRNIFERNFSRLVRETGAYAEYFLAMQRQLIFLNELSDRKDIKKKLTFIDHHLAHAASAVRCSGFEDSILITLDGVGEDNAGLLGYFKDNRIHRLRSIPINQSLGWLYGEVTSLCGFKSHSHEGKTMGLAAFGKPDLGLFNGIAELNPRGYELKKDFAKKLKSKIIRRLPSEEISDYQKNLAATVQHFLEEAVFNLAKDVSKFSTSRNLCLAGGVALNCDMNFRLSTSREFDNIYVQPAANDAGTALGAALEVASKFSKPPRNHFLLKHAQYGPRYGSDEIEDMLKESKISYRKASGSKEIAKLIADGKIVAWFNGRMEFGPRALGGRSILANPSIFGMKEKINAECKHRENWRPFAPSVLKEYCDEYFENYHHSPFMLMTFKVKEQHREKLAATIHVDDTARVQEVDMNYSPKYYEVIEEFRKITGIAAVLDTSFNDKEKPICLTPRDAVQTFFTTGIDVLVLENFILEK